MEREREGERNTSHNLVTEHSALVYIQLQNVCQCFLSRMLNARMWQIINVSQSVKITTAGRWCERFTRHDQRHENRQRKSQSKCANSFQGKVPNS